MTQELRLFSAPDVKPVATQQALGHGSNPKSINGAGYLQNESSWKTTKKGLNQAIRTTGAEAKVS